MPGGLRLLLDSRDGSLESAGVPNGSAKVPKVPRESVLDPLPSLLSYRPVTVPGANSFSTQ